MNCATKSRVSSDDNMKKSARTQFWLVRVAVTWTTFLKLLTCSALGTRVESAFRQWALNNEPPPLNAAVLTPDIPAYAVDPTITPASALAGLSPGPMSAAQGHVSFAEYPMCDVSFESTVCFHNGEQVLMPPARPFGLVGHYTFDEERPYDSSGARNHATGEFYPGPGHGGHGTSALFRKSYILVPHSKTLTYADFSYTFWVYLLNDEVSSRFSSGLKDGEMWCPRRIKVVLTTNEVSASEGEFLTSNSKIRRHAWVHLAVVRHQARLRLYVNGILDSTILTQGTTKPNRLALYIGGTPWVENECDMPLLLDDLRVYNVGIGRDQIQAEAATALAGVESSYVHLSCVACTKLQAEEGCPASYHLCTKLEFYTGAYQAVRSLGLLEPDTHVFTGEMAATDADLEGITTDQAEPKTGLGLCCADNSP